MVCHEEKEEEEEEEEDMKKKISELNSYVEAWLYKYYALCYILGTHTHTDTQIFTVFLFLRRIGLPWRKIRRGVGGRYYEEKNKWVKFIISHFRTLYYVYS